MAKGGFSGKPKKSHGFKPYDSTNSSFVRRLTTRVSEILPQPSSWFTKWLSPGAPSDVETNLEKVENEEGLVHPNAKRPRLNSNNLHNQRPIPEDANISPIMSSNRVDDRAMAGPSGLHLKKVTTSTLPEPHFISSTPAIAPPSHHHLPPSTSPNVDTIKVNGDDASESGESTSGCSSLVPQGERSDYPFSTPRPIPPETPKLSTSLHSLNTSASRSFHSRSKYPKLDLSSSSTSRERPSFDSFIFNNPHVTSVRDDRSPFHSGRTMYGGAAGNKETLSESILSASPHLKKGPSVISVRPCSSQSNQTRDVVGTSAMRILRALDHFSSPILDAKRIPVRSSNDRLKRKAPSLQPYNELSIPQMPQLLRIKRRHAEMSASKQSDSQPLKPPSSSTSGIAAAPPSIGLEKKLTSIQPPPTQPPPPKESTPSHNKAGYSLREDDSKNTQRHVGSIKRKGNEVLENEETVTMVNLPKVKLDVKTLPKFNISLPPQTQTTSKKSPTVAKKSSVKESQQDSKPCPFLPSKSSPTKPTESKSEFKFSQPIIVSSAPTENVIGVKPKFSFSLPIDPTTSSSQVQPSSVEKVLKPPLVKKKVEAPKTELLHGRSVMEILGKSKEPSTEEKRTCSECSTPINSDKCTKCEDKKLNSATSLWSSIKKPTDNWSCKECFVSNNNNVDKCVACSTSRIPVSTPPPSKTTSASDSFWSNASKKTDQWSCKECFSPNPSKEEKCLACTAPKSAPTTSKTEPEVSSALTSTTSSNKVNSFWGAPKASDKWSCKECFVPNTNADSKCVACSSPRNPPSSKTTTTDSNTVSTSVTGPPLLPLTQNKGWECSVCLVNNKADAEECAACTTPKPGSKPKPKPTTTFSFGIPPSEEKKSSATFSFGVAPSENQPKTSDQLSFGTPADSSKPQFTFGIPNKGEKKQEKEEKAPEKSATEKPSTLISNSFSAPEKTEASSSHSKPPPVFMFGSTQPNKSLDAPKVEAVEVAKPEDKGSEDPVGFGQPGGVQDSTFKNLFASKPSSTFGKQETKTGSPAPVSFFGTPSTSDTAFNSDKKPTMLFGSQEPAKSLFGGSQSATESTPSIFSKDSKPADSFKKATSEASTFASPTPLFSASKNQPPKQIFQPITSPESTLGSFQPKPLTNSTNPQDAKSSLFTFGAQASSEKKVTNAFSTPSEKPPFFGNSLEKTPFNSQPSVFPSNGVVNSVTSGPSSFGFNNTSEAPSKPNLFGSYHSDPAQQSTSSLFTFNKDDTSEKKPLAMGGFNFSNSPAQPSFNFSAQPSTAPQMTPSVTSPPNFGSFNATPFSTAQQTTGFSFGQPSQPVQQPTSAPHVFGQNQNPGGSGSNPVFTFNATQQKPVSATAPPTFDPNIKPNIKFTGGSIPTFSAMPMEGASEESTSAPRMIKKAIRRTKLNR